MELLKQLIASPGTAVALLLVYAAGLGAATFVEKYLGTDTARAVVYYSPLFFLLQLLLVANFVAVAIRRRLVGRRRWGALVTHGAFVVILLGALVSHLCGEEGVVHIREGETTDRMRTMASGQAAYRSLPFRLELVRFTLSRYPGSDSPSAYESELLVHVDGQTLRASVYMNHVLDVKGYRFYQASYDPDERGTILSVNRDVAGRNITYVGYLLLVAGFALSLFGPNTRVRELARQLESLRKAASCLLLAVGALSAGEARAQDPSVGEMEAAVLRYAVDPGHAERFAALPTQAVNGRMLPVNTFSSEVLRKLHKSDRYGTLNSDQFLLSVLAMPDMWARIPFIQCPNDEVARAYGLTEGACAFAEAFDEGGGYKLRERLEEAYNRAPAERDRFEKDLINLDERLNIFHQLASYQLPRLFPRADDPAGRWYAPGDDLSGYAGQDSLFVAEAMTWYLAEVRRALMTADWGEADRVLGLIDRYQQARGASPDIRPEKMRAEIRYNRLDVFRQCKKAYLILGGLSLACAFAALFRRARWTGYLSVALACGVAAAFLFHACGMALRWYIAGYAPWSNSYETMVYVAWAAVLGGWLFVRRSWLVFALATLFGGVLLFVSGLSWMDPQINPLVPVLKSPWLMFHVAVIVAAYGFFGIGCLIGLTDLILLALGGRRGGRLRDRARELTIANEMALWIGLALMTVGTFLGAVWANESWGRYWGWDPKETWALVTVVVYAVVTHLRMVPRLAGTWLFNLASVVAFYAVLMTYFGVNYFLSGMHSYGANDEAGALFGYLYLSAALVAALGWLSYPRKSSRPSAGARE